MPNDQEDVVVEGEEEQQVSERDRKVGQVVATIRETMPNAKLFLIEVPGREEEIFIAKKGPWNEYKKLIGAVKGESGAFEALIDKYLVYPKPEYQMIQQEWDPGLVLVIGEQIQRGLGFTKGASIKNL